MTTPADLQPGTRVVVQHAGHLSGQTGVVVEGPGSGYEAIVRLDEHCSDLDCELAFYAHELKVAP